MPNKSILIPKNAKQLFISGPVGQLDSLILTPINKPIGIAIICHPDPKGGGTYTNKIVQTIAKVLTEHGYLCCCPNLRGVGESAGTHDFGRGEVADLAAIYQFLHEQYTDLPLILAGFSFGSSVVSQLAAKVIYKWLILIGPAVTNYPVEVLDNSKTIVIHGELDDIIPVAAVLEWGRKYNQAIIWVPGCGHFFHGKLLNLQILLNTIAL